MKNFDDFWKDTLDCGLIPKTHPNLGEIEYAARLGFMAAIALKGSEKEDELRIHNERMEFDPLYAAEMSHMLSITKDKEFSIGLKCIEPYFAMELLRSLYVKNVESTEKLVAGCRIYRIDNLDRIGRVDNVKNKLKELINHLDDGTI